MQSSDGYACSVPGQPVVVSCAEREQPSRPSYIAGGSGLEAPWLKLQTEKETPAYCKYYNVSISLSTSAEITTRQRFVSYLQWFQAPWFQHFQAPRQTPVLSQPWDHSA